VEAKGTILRWGWLLLDRRVSPFDSRSFMHLTHPRCDLRLKAHAENAIPDELYEKRLERWPVDTPSTKEAYYIRDIFDGKLSLEFIPLLCLSTKIASLHRLVHVRRRSENSRSVCTSLFVEPAPWPRLILNIGGFRVETGVAPQTLAEGVLVSTMRRMNDDKWL
jgi:hypothetical protein